jgi:hypothetical protein
MGIVNSHDVYSEEIFEDNTLKEKVNNMEVIIYKIKLFQKVNK